MFCLSQLAFSRHIKLKSALSCAAQLWLTICDSWKNPQASSASGIAVPRLWLLPVCRPLKGRGGKSGWRWLNAEVTVLCSSCHVKHNVSLVGRHGQMEEPEQNSLFNHWILGLAMDFLASMCLHSGSQSLVPGVSAFHILCKRRGASFCQFFCMCVCDFLVS